MMRPFWGPVTGQLSTWAGVDGSRPYRFGGSANPLGWGRAVWSGALTVTQCVRTQQDQSPSSQWRREGGCLLPPLPLPPGVPTPAVARARACASACATLPPLIAIA